MSSAAAGVLGAFGLDRGLPFPIADVAQSDAILLVGSNLAETMPPVMRHFEEQRHRGGALIVVDPRLTPTAAAATLHLQLTPGTDAALLNGLLHIAIQSGAIDEAFIARRTSGFDAVRRVVASYWPGRVERITGVPEGQLREAVRLLAAAKTAMVLTAPGTGAAEPRRRQRARLHQPDAGARPGRPRGKRIRLPDGTGQRAGRAGARTEGRPVARLSQTGQRGGSRARRRHLGRPRAGAPTAGTLGLRDARRDGRRRRRPRPARVRLQPGDLGAPRRPHRSAPGRPRLSGGGRLLSLRDRSPRRRRAADGAMGRRGRHDDQSRGARDPAAARRSRRRTG